MADKVSLRIGERLEVNIRGFPIEGMTAFVPPGPSLLRRTGILEYAFSGEVEATQSEPVGRRSGQVWNQLLLRCGLPVTLNYFGPLASESELARDVSGRGAEVGSYLAGMMVAKAEISFVHPSGLIRIFGAKLERIAIVKVGAHDGVSVEHFQADTLDWAEVVGAHGTILDIEASIE